MKTKVAIVSCKDYERKNVLPAVAKCVDLCGGVASILKKDPHVFLKPNLLMAKPPEKATTTHPEIVFAVASLLKEHSASMSMGDSPALGVYSNVLKKTGMEKIAQELGISLVEFQESLSRKLPDGIFHLELAKECLETSCLINLPKLKTHSQMLMTLAVKNLFGCVVGTRKVNWHFRSGIDYHYFARLLVEICLALKPAYNLVDGIIGMQGDGPNHGDPRAMGILVGGENPFAVDFVICRIVGIDPGELFTIKMARKMDVFGTREEEIDIVGESIENVYAKNFIRPKNHPLLFGPPFLRKSLRKHFTAKPLIVDSECKKCMACQKICPAQAIYMKGENLQISYQDCIRCFCCQEVCPHKAILTQESKVLQIFKKFFPDYSGKA
ncbi:MAG: DUF362 domain-containing protein [Candidatus Brocadiae bacterium]|nr:DUF362 domain-containing protein [Candidatus Brocadiia bacterium]